jgi:hypothetical protein
MKKLAKYILMTIACILDLVIILNLIAFPIVTWLNYFNVIDFTPPYSTLFITVISCFILEVFFVNKIKQINNKIQY